MNDLCQVNLRTVPYPVFLKTDYWKSVRAQKIEQVGGCCEMCGRRSGLEVHHASYENRGAELAHMGDLVVLCRQCHADEHEIVLREDVRSAVMEASVSCKAKVIGLEMANHWSAKHARLRVKLESLSGAAGKSKKATILGVNELIDANVFVRVRTGRSSIYYAGPAIGQKKTLRRQVPRTPIGPALGVKDKRTPLNGC